VVPFTGQAFLLIFAAPSNMLSSVNMNFDDTTAAPWISIVAVHFVVWNQFSLYIKNVSHKMQGHKLIIHGLKSLWCKKNVINKYTKQLYL
jgi:hypothetical protein